MGEHAHELLHVAAAVLFVVAGASALREYRTLRERVVLTYGAMCLCAAAYATHVVISHNLPKQGAFWMPWTSVNLLATFGATLFYLLTMQSFVGARSRLFSATLVVQVGLGAVAVADLLATAITGRSFLFFPVPRAGLGAHQRALGEGAYSLRPLAELVAGLFVLSFGVVYLAAHLLRTRSRDATVYAGLILNATIVANDGLVALGVFGGVYLMAFSKAFETIRIHGDIRARAHDRIERRLRQAEKMEAIGRMAGGIAHDFNNILFVVGSNVEMAAERARAGLGDGEELEMATEGVCAGQRLVGQLLDIARAQEREAEYVDINAFLAQTTRLLTTMASASTRLEVSCEAVLGGVMIDPTQLTQVLMNLVINARDAMPQGGTIKVQAASSPRRLSLGQRREHRPTPKIVISVSDEGVGIPPDVIEHVFEPFFTTKAEQGGSGLGLATLYSIVTKAGGQVEVESELGRGSSFHVALPRANAQ